MLGENATDEERKRGAAGGGGGGKAERPCKFVSTYRGGRPAAYR
jgi:hypothetical protein